MEEIGVKKEYPYYSTGGVGRRVTTYYEDAKAFHRAFHDPPVRPILPDAKTWAVRVRLITEELAETCREYTFDNLVGFADGLVDLTWVVLGSAVVAGLPYDELWAEVRRANMDKFVGGARRDASGKILKPDGWRPPEIERILFEALPGGR